MSNNDQSVFTFELNESLSFKKGQEVEELMGVSLEPEISIQDFDDYVSIRGVIELNGEYFQVNQEDDAEEEQVVSLRDSPSKRLMERVEQHEDGVNEFFHRFPVEISVPKYRIHSLDEVRVGIESFDYELPEKSQLKLNAMVAIHGVQNEDESNRFDEETNAEAVLGEAPPAGEPVDETFHFDVKEKKDKQAENEDTADVESESSSEKGEKDRWKYKKTQSLADFFGNTKDKDDEPKEEEDSVFPDDVEEDVIFNDDADDIDDNGQNKEFATVTHISEYEDESPDFSESPESPREGSDPKYLLNIFDEKEEGLASMKMRIVQEKDTLESIAEKYEMSPLQISKTNRLEEDSLSEGQILYIPTIEKKET